jgi:hypothetical protein
MRSSIDDVEVEMVRLEDKGVSFNQLMMSFTLLACGILSYYFVPQAAVRKDL